MSIDGKKAIVYVHGNNMTIGEAFEFLTRIDCNDVSIGQKCAWRFDGGYSVVADNSKGQRVRFDIYKEEE